MFADVQYVCANWLFLFMLKIKMMKKRILIFASLAVAVVATWFVLGNQPEKDLTSRNIEALAGPTGPSGGGPAGNPGDFIGCPGGNKKCFTGSISYGGGTISGTWYQD